MILFATLIGGASAWALGIAALAAVQRRLIFRPPKGVRDVTPGPHTGTYEVQVLTIEVAKGVVLEGWRSVPRTRPIRGTLLYFGGRGENTAWAPHMASYLAGWTVLSINYRGFGQSGGRACERSVMADALMVSRRFVAEAEASGLLVVGGRSLGSAVALRVAREARAAALVLMTPPCSVRDLVVASPWLRPARALLRHPMDGLAHAPHVDCPALILIAPADRRVPNEHSLRLASRLRGPVRLQVLAGETHRSLPRSSAAQWAVAQFLMQLDGSAVRSSEPVPSSNG